MQAKKTVTQVTPKGAVGPITKAIKAGLVPMLHGSPAIGKSAIVHQIAEQFGLKVIDLRLSQCDPTDLLGFPTIANGRGSYAVMDTFPIEGDPIPAGYNGWLLFLDELVSAPQSVQAAAYKIILDRMVGNHKLHKNVAIVGAGNLETDNAIVQPMSTALKSRMMHLHLMVNHEEWLEWAQKNNFSYFITAYIAYKPNALYRFDPNSDDDTYPSPRTWHFMNKTMKVVELTDPDMLAMAGGNISEGEAREFLTFCTVEKELPKLADIIHDPRATKVPSEPSVLFLLSGFLGQHATDKNIDPLVTYIMRMPAEFRVVALREIIRRNPSFMGTPAIQRWVEDTANNLL